MKTDEQSAAGRILIADDDPNFLEAFGQMLEMRGYQTESVVSTARLLEVIQKKEFDLVTLDLEWEVEGKSGLDIFDQVRNLDPLLPVIIITGKSSIPTAIEATRMGAFDYLEKIYDREKILVTIKNALETGRLKRENRYYLEQIKKRYSLIGRSQAMQAVKEQIRRIGPSNSVVLISGESGTGKELVARQIHLHSRRHDRKFVSVDSGLISDSLAESELFGYRKGAFTGALNDRDGLFAEAEGGTLFLDEISNASLNLQAKLLHVIQEREYRRVGDSDYRKCDVRLISASNQNLEELIEKGKFRKDLYYRLKVIELKLPPLRERKEDIPFLAHNFIKIKSGELSGTSRSLSREAVNFLMDYDWPGNVRELENTTERLVVLASEDEITLEEAKLILGDIINCDSTSSKSLNDLTRDFRRKCIIKALSLSGGRVSRAAEMLQVDRTHLYRLIGEYQLKNLLNHFQ